MNTSIKSALIEAIVGNVVAYGSAISPGIFWMEYGQAIFSDGQIMEFRNSNDEHSPAKLWIENGLYISGQESETSKWVAEEILSILEKKANKWEIKYINVMDYPQDYKALLKRGYTPEGALKLLA